MESFNKLQQHVENDLPDTSKSGMQELELKPTKFYVDKIGLPS